LVSDASHPSKPSDSEARDLLLSQWQTWQSAAENVTRAWNNCLAAEGGERDQQYRCSIRTLDVEDQEAAELERMINPNARQRTGHDCIAANTDSL
jgi:hypothetical protein